MSKSIRKASRPSRRRFLKGAAAMAAPLVVPSSVLGLGGRTAPSDRVTVGYIGVGGMGTAHLKVDTQNPGAQIVAVCDVFASKRERARKLVEDAYVAQKRTGRHNGVSAYRDFREILARPDVDGVVIAPLHYWHTVMAVMAAQAGKSVYVEKMCAVTLGEAQALSGAVKRHGVVFQHGTQGRSMPSFRHAAELVRNGRIGKVRRAEITCLRPFVVHPGPHGPVGAWTNSARTVPVPDGFDWDLYLGPCPWKPYTGNLETGGFMFGMLADFASHTVDSAQMVLGMDGSGPVEFCPGGTGGYKKMTFRYANGVEVTSPANPNDPEINDFGIRVIGTEGTIGVSRGGCWVRPAHLDRRPVGPDEWHINPNVAEWVGSAASNVVASNTRKGPRAEANTAGVGAHKTNWLHCIRTGQKTNAHEDIGRRSASACVLVDMARVLGRPLRWDPQKEQIVGDEEGTRLWDYPKRTPWQAY